MAEGKKDEGAGDPIKILLEDALEKQRNAMMDNFFFRSFNGCPPVAHLNPTPSSAKFPPPHGGT
jgi:hypothetical protein